MGEFEIATYDSHRNSSLPRFRGPFDANECSEPQRNLLRKKFLHVCERNRWEYPIVTGYKGSNGAYSYDVAPDGSFVPHNCTSYVAYRFYQVMGYRDANYNRLSDAGSWATNATKYIPGALVSGSPSEDDIAQWNWGHVAWVDYFEYDTSGWLAFIVISEDTCNLKVTRRRKLSPLVKDEWPHNFISLPIFGGGGGGGGGHMIATSSPYSP